MMGRLCDSWSYMALITCGTAVGNWYVMEDAQGIFVEEEIYRIELKERLGFLFGLAVFLKDNIL